MSIVERGQLAAETRRIVRAYDDRCVPVSYLGFEAPHHAARVAERNLLTLELLYQLGIKQEGVSRSLDLGCGTGDATSQLDSWGLLKSTIIGVDLRADALTELANRDRAGSGVQANGAELPFADNSMDLAILATVLSSIRAAFVRRALAAEVKRVLRPGGAVVVYDMRVTNPRNGDVRKVTRAEVFELFDGFDGLWRSLTVLPPVAARLPVRRGRPVGAGVLGWFPPLRTHGLFVGLKP